MKTKNAPGKVGCKRTRPLPKQLRNEGNRGGKLEARRRKPAQARPWLPKGVSELEYDLTYILSNHNGERYQHRRHGEGAVEVLTRIIAERDAAMRLLSLDRMKEA